MLGGEPLGAAILGITMERLSGATPASYDDAEPVSTGPWAGETADAAALYDLIAASYQRWWVPVILPTAIQLLDLVEPAVVDRPDSVVVDVGAGTGSLARAAAQRWPHVRVVAVDPSEGMLELGRAEAARTLDAAARRRIRWIPGVAEQLPVVDRSVDAVVSSFTLQYLPNRAAAMREAYRACRSGGAIGIVTWRTGDWSFTPWRILDSVVNELGIVRPPSSEGCRFRSLASAATLLRRAGFRRVRATAGLVDCQWTVEPLVRCTVEEEERRLFDALEPAIARHLERLWQRRLEGLGPADLRYRDGVAFVSGLRGLARQAGEPSHQASTRGA